MSIEFILGIVLGALTGVLATVLLQPSAERLKARTTSLSRRVFHREPEQPTDLHSLGFVQLLVWSPRRPLDPHRHRIVVDHSAWPDQDWFPRDRWLALRTDVGRRFTGPASGVSGYTIDTGEAGTDSLAFEISIRSSDYADGIALQQLGSEDALWQSVEGRLSSNSQLALATAPPHSFYVALTLSTRSGQTLASRRSPSTVATAGGVWSLAACETMKAPPLNPGQVPEDLFDLAHRAALEEYGLHRHELGPIWFSWFGYGKMNGLFAVAHTTTSLGPDTVIDRVRAAEGGYESDALKWVGTAGPEVKELSVAAPHQGWLNITPVVARGLLLMHATLETAPVRR